MSRLEKLEQIEQSVSVRGDINPTLVGSYEILLSSVLVVVDVFMC